MSLSPEVEALRASVADAVSDHALDDPKLYDALVQIGVLELDLPELGIVLEELGRGGYAGPVLSTAVAAIALPEVREGYAICGLGLAQPGLDGAECVIDGVSAEVILLERDGLLHRVTAATREGLRTTDIGREIARIEVSASEPVGDVALLEKVRAAALVAIASEQVGGAQAALDQAVEYSKIRSQFGRQIGSFQSLKHLCADMFVAVTSARAVARKAAQALHNGDTNASELASIAKAWCSDAYVQCGEANVQIHGGIGFTWEHSAHLHLRRAKSDEQLFGDAAFHRAKLATQLGI